MKLKVSLFYLILLLIYSCADKSVEQPALRWLEDIPFDIVQDDKDFTTCHGDEHIYQYFNLGDNIAIEGDKPRILSHFEQNYDASAVPKESGLIRVRFIVNCNGETDRFRIIESDLNYNERRFHKSISNQIFMLTKSLSGWQQKHREDGQPVDYYQYLIFKIVDGNITNILP